MIRNVTGQEATRRTWKGHGRPRYGFWFGFFQLGTKGIPVELGLDRGMVKATDRRDGTVVARFGSATRFWLAPIPMPREGDELIYTAEGDHQEYRVRVLDTSDEQYSLVDTEMISDGMGVKIRAERLRYPLDELQEQAIAEDAERFPVAFESVPDGNGVQVQAGDVVAGGDDGPLRVVAVGVQPRDHDYIDEYTYVELVRRDGSTVQRWSRRVSVAGARARLDELHADALAEDAVRPWPVGWKRYELESLKGSDDMRMRDRRDGAIVAVLHNVEDGWAPQLADGTRLNTNGPWETAGVAMARVEAFIARRAALAAVPELIALDEGPTCWPLTVVAEEQNPLTGMWAAGPGGQVSTDLTAQQLAEQIGTALDMEGTHRVLVWRRGQSAPSGEHIVTIPSHQDAAPTQAMLLLVQDGHRGSDGEITWETITSEQVTSYSNPQALADDTETNQNVTSTDTWRVQVFDVTGETLLAEAGRINDTLADPIQPSLMPVGSLAARLRCDCIVEIGSVEFRQDPFDPDEDSPAVPYHQYELVYPCTDCAAGHCTAGSIGYQPAASMVPLGVSVRSPKGATRIHAQDSDGRAVCFDLQHIEAPTSSDPDAVTCGLCRVMIREAEEDAAAGEPAQLPGFPRAAIAENCLCTHRPVGDRGPLAQRVHRVEGSGDKMHCPVPGHRSCTCNHRPLDCTVPGHLTGTAPIPAAARPEQGRPDIDSYAPTFAGPLYAEGKHRRQLAGLIHEYALAMVRCERIIRDFRFTADDIEQAGRALSRAARPLETYISAMPEPDTCGCTFNLDEVRMSDCRYGCKIWRCGKHGGERIIHSAAYGCPLGS